MVHQPSHRSRRGPNPRVVALASACCLVAALAATSSPASAATSAQVDTPAAATTASHVFAGYRAPFSGNGSVTATQVVARALPQFSTSQVLSEIGLQGSTWGAAATLTYVSSTNRVLYQIQVGNSAIDVHVGDTVQMTMTWRSATSRWYGQIVDVTTSEIVSASGAESSGPTLAYIDMARYSGQLIPRFAPTSFTAARIHGVTLASVPGLTAEQMTSDSGQRMVTAGPVTKGTFTETFVSAGP